MPQLVPVATVTNGADNFLTSITDLLLVRGEAGPTLYSISNAPGGISQIPLTARLNSSDLAYLSESAGLDAAGTLTEISIDGSPALMVTGVASGAFQAVWLNQNDGGISDVFTLPGAVAPGAVLAIAPLQLDAQSFFVGALSHGSGLHVWQMGAGGRITEIAQGIAGEVWSENDVHALATVEIEGAQYVLAASVTDNSLTTLALDTQGQLQIASQIDARDGLFINAPNSIETIQVGGQAYALLGAAGTSSISVVALGPGGRMEVTDQINDDLGTRFDGMTTLETVTMGDQVYVLAGGADDGVSLLTLLPGGKLVQIGTLADGLETALSDPAAAAMIADATGLDIFVAGDVPASVSDQGMGISHIKVELGPAGLALKLGDGGDSVDGGVENDQISGGAGDDQIRGGAGADILQDGAGADSLWGGEGQDVFVLDADGRTDFIMDYEPGIDRLDLSSMAWFYTKEALDIAPTATGADIRIGDERVIVNTADGSSLSAADFETSDLRDLWHTAINPLEVGDIHKEGTAQGDLIDGRGGDDLLVGNDGSDILQGMAGDDLLNGGQIDRSYDPFAAQVFRVYQATLDRAPDENGLHYWTDLLSSGAVELQEVADRFINSPEFQSNYAETSDSEFLTLLYQNVLDRDPDDGGLTYWLDQLDQGVKSREEIVLGFSESPEFRDSTEIDTLMLSHASAQTDFTDDVFRLYQATLGREPNLGGMMYWSEMQADGMEFLDVVSGFVNSPEFTSTYGNLDDAGFVSLLYQNVLGRAPDSEGLTWWVDQLDSGGYTREKVVASFAQSPEMITQTSQPQIDWFRSFGFEDQLDGGEGYNLLQGGAMADQFVFRADEDGHHVIIDIEPWDRLSFDGFNYSSATEARSHMVEAGSGVTFTDQGVTVEFIDADLGLFTDGMFDVSG
ncbi:DUF4214 domain-containing protein [Thioclava sp. JE_KL1]|uniref:DUF4214 domain-containing protein n=1 Tax=Thioclava sp. JE_KL1 TaxID=2651187 RepID=UPI00128DE72D|nr:DUF4214 domain-containing protein [Thioclava sp. JE_KL1]MPQ95899.1 DUF4214 domain-containing protein [Thioclava sp. JE_KL1]